MALSSRIAPRRAPGSPIRVLLVDDSVVVRGLVKRWLEAARGIEVVGAAIDGLDGVEKTRELQPDIVILDVEMPKLDGLSALPKIRAAAPRCHVLMASTLTKRNASVTLEALAQGAADYLPKPDNTRLAGADDF